VNEFSFLVFVALLFAVARLFFRLKDTETQLGDFRERLRRLESDLPEKPAMPASVARTPYDGKTSTEQSVAPAPPATPFPPPLPPAPRATGTTFPPVIEPRETITASPQPDWARVWKDEAGEARSARRPAEEEREKDHEKEVEQRSLPEVTLEAFMGVKLFAWVGGLALFLGIVFFVKYSFEHNLITPEMRVAIGTLTGLGLIAGGLLMPRPKFTVTAQTLCATGIVTLYGVTYAAYGVYHFLHPITAFGTMAGITAAAFLLAVRLDAQVVAVLGLLGGFLTPLLVSTGEDNAPALFGYLAALDVGLIAVALRRRWRYLIPLGAAATVLLQVAWVAAFFTPEKISTAAIIFLGFETLFLLPFWLCHGDAEGDKWTTVASGISAAAAILFAGHLLDFPSLAGKPWIGLSILFAADAALVVWPLRHPAREGGPLFGGAAAFFILGIWNVRYLNETLLPWALGYILLFAAFHTVLPIVLRKLRPTEKTPPWVQIFPALALTLMLWPAFSIGASLSLWIAVLFADLAAIALAALTASFLGLVAALVLTLVATGLWLEQTPVDHPDLNGLLVVIAGFAALFCGASVLLQKRLREIAGGPAADSLERDAAEHLPAISAAVPFLLLISTVLRLHPADPSSIFGVGLLLVLVLLGLANWSKTTALPPVALVCATLLEYSWHFATEGRPGGWVPLGWCLGFTAIVFAFPFFFQSRSTPQAGSWITAALAPVLHYPLLQKIVAQSWPEFWDRAGGLLPAALAIPPLIACDYLRRRLPKDHPGRLTVLAWFGGVTLLFITLIFPVQFQKESLTLSWALEGTALLWLFHRVPHRGLRIVGFGLLCVAFVRLALNPAVFDYHARSGVPIWNWYLYTYGIGATCFFAATQLTAPPRDRLGDIALPATFSSLGTILLFLLLNIEIADYFSTTPTLTFDFEGNLARDMTYSIAWSLFALVLLLIGMHRQIAGVRYTGIGLLVLTLVKLFLHDLAQLDQLYRIGAFIAVALVLIGASYLYQRFLATDGEARKAE
jgi:uncharacterized membrane protein